MTAVYSVVMLTLLVKHGKSIHHVVLDEDDTVSTLMHSVEVLSGVPIRHQKLICHGKVLNAPDTLKASKVKAGSKLLLMTSGSQTQGQVAAQELIKHKAAAAQQRAEDFKQKQSKLGKVGDAPAASMQTRASRWAAVGIASLQDEKLSSLPDELWPVGPSIRVADFGINRLTSIPSTLSAFSALQRLRLSHNQLSDEGMPWPALATMSQLAVLALDHNRLA